MWTLPALVVALNERPISWVSSFTRSDTAERVILATPELSAAPGL